MPTIAFLASALSIHTIRWLNAFALLGHKVHLITLHPVNKYDALDSHIKLHRLHVPAPSGYFCGFSAHRILKQIKPDIVHAHYASGYGTLLRLSGFHPAVLSVWGGDVFEFPYQSRLHENILRANLAYADYITSTSNFMKPQIGRFLTGAKKIDVIPFGVDCARFKPMNSKGMSETIIGTTKSLEKKYGIDYLLKVFTMVKQKYKGKQPLRLLLCGEGTQKKKLEAMVKHLGISDSVTFTGYISHALLPDMLNQFTVYAALSIAESETFGVAVLEACACGVPVVVSDVGGLPEIVKDGLSGFIVPVKDETRAAEKILQLIEDKELRDRTGLNARKFVLDNYSWTNNVNQMESLYKEIIRIQS